MCFSAEASFTAGIVLTVVGIASIKKVCSPSQIPFASIPLIFAAQQTTEGFLWVALSNATYANWQQPAIYIFLTFAQVIWPSWVPFSMMLLEKDEKRKKILYLLLGIGVIVSLYLCYHLITSQKIHAEIKDHHIYYELSFPVFVARTFGILYFISIILPSFVSSFRKMWLLGLTILISYFSSKILYENYVISVWCFFAAVISISIYYLLYCDRKALLKAREDT